MLDYNSVKFHELACHTIEKELGLWKEGGVDIKSNLNFWKYTCNSSPHFLDPFTDHTSFLEFTSATDIISIEYNTNVYINHSNRVYH
jgi:hypothetical protein